MGASPSPLSLLLMVWQLFSLPSSIVVQTFRSSQFSLLVWWLRRWYGKLAINAADFLEAQVSKPVLEDDFIDTAMAYKVWITNSLGDICVSLNSVRCGIR